MIAGLSQDHQGQGSKMIMENVFEYNLFHCRTRHETEETAWHHYIPFDFRPCRHVDSELDEHIVFFTKSATKFPIIVRIYRIVDVVYRIYHFK